MTNKEFEEKIEKILDDYIREGKVPDLVRDRIVFDLLGTDI